MHIWNVFLVVRRLFLRNKCHANDIEMLQVLSCLGIASLIAVITFIIVTGGRHIVVPYPPPPT